MHVTTNAREKRKILKKDAQALTRKATTARKVAKTLPGPNQTARELAIEYEMCTLEAARRWIKKWWQCRRPGR